MEKYKHSERYEKEQRADPKLKHIIDFLETRPISQLEEKHNPHVLVYGLLYKIKNSEKHYSQQVIVEKYSSFLKQCKAKYYNRFMTTQELETGINRKHHSGYQTECTGSL